MADTLFVQLVWEHIEFNEDFDWQTFMYVSHTAYNLADRRPPTTTFRSACNVPGKVSTVFVGVAWY